MNLNDLALWWNRVYNGVVIENQTIGYLLLSFERLMIGVAAWFMLRSLARYIALAFPPPHTAANAVYWLRWWFWLRLRDFGLLKIGAAAVAVLLILQIPTGAGGDLARASVYLLLIYPALYALMIGTAQLLHALSNRIEHPEVPHDTTDVDHA